MEVRQKDGLTITLNKDIYKADPCLICGLTEKSHYLYGDFIVAVSSSTPAIKCHYFCLLTGTNLQQNGISEKGIFGFLIPDIERGLTKSTNYKCCYCHGKQPMVFCSVKKCSAKFHYICGYKNNARTNFSNNFESYCHKHNNIKRIDKNIVLKKGHVDDELCFICYDKMGPYNPVTSMYPPCCQLQWFHRNCMLQFTISAGYYTQCPIPACHKTEFRDIIKKFGIFVPDREATWELESNAFKELYKKQCCSMNCQVVGSRFKKRYFIKCYVCHCIQIHRCCLSADVKDDEFCCVECHEASLYKI